MQDEVTVQKSGKGKKSSKRRSRSHRDTAPKSRGRGILGYVGVGLLGAALGAGGMWAYGKYGNQGKTV